MNQNKEKNKLTKKNKIAITIGIITLAIIIIFICINLTKKEEAVNNFNSEYEQLITQYQNIEVKVSAYSNMMNKEIVESFYNIKAEIEELNSENVKEPEKSTTEKLEETTTKCNKIREKMQNVEIEILQIETKLSPDYQEPIELEGMPK